MTIFVLDSSAVLRFIDKQAGWPRMAEILASHRNRTAEIVVSAVQWGEIAGAVRKKLGAHGQNQVMNKLSQFQLRILPATGQRAVRAAELKIDTKLSYADAFVLELALDTPDHLLVTADFDFKKVDELARIEFLPAK